jgi:Kef-type K+ transport system membrane component KefB
VTLATLVSLHRDDATMTLLGLAVIVLAARLGGRLACLARQPPVIGEILVGVALGPTLLGSHSTELFPLTSRPALDVLSTLGVVSFMAVVGAELELPQLRSRGRIAASVGTLATAVPFGLGAALGVVLYARHGHGISETSFTLFFGALMSITAFPVLARILRARGLDDKPLGSIAMACAATNDVLTWVILALVVAVITSSGASQWALTVALIVAFGLVMALVVRPLLQRWATSRPDGPGTAAIVAGALLCAVGTSALGIHEIFGAFLFGAVLPRGEAALVLRSRLEGLSETLLPVFFVVTGLSVDFSRISGGAIGSLALILLVACGGKVLSAGIGGRLNGLRCREAAALGIVMNTRGLTELVVVSLGRSLGVLDRELFTSLVLMAIVTTAATGPLLSLLRPDPYLSDGLLVASRAG